MKQRVITALVAAVVFIGFLVGMYTVAFPILLALLSVIAINEIADTIKLKNMPIRILSLVTAAIIPFVAQYRSSGNIIINYIMAFLDVIIIAYIMAQFVFMLFFFKKTTFEQAAIMVLTSLIIPGSFSVFILVRDANVIFPYFPSGEKAYGVFFVLFAMFASWFTDIFALLTGVKLGKHKLCPAISPKKTVEGAVGGIVGAVVMNVILLAVFNRFFFVEKLIPHWMTIVTTVVLSVISMFGDLAASTIKRNFGVKDFGKLLPGHGGIMDRFDSCLFVFPATYAALRLFNAFMI